jgi:hypothetical protein
MYAQAVSMRRAMDDFAEALRRLNSIRIVSPIEIAVETVISRRPINSRRRAFMRGIPAHFKRTPHGGRLDYG